MVLRRVRFEEIGEELQAVGAYWSDEPGTGIEPGDRVKVLWLVEYMCIRDFCNPVMERFNRSDTWRSLWD